MSLPPGNSSWPPAPVTDLLQVMRTWDAWYAGDANRLAAVYGGATGSANPVANNFFASDQGGFKATIGRALQRWFWGEPTQGPNRRLKMHIPIAADLCQASADLLFADAPTLTVETDTTQARLDLMADDGLFATLAQAAEVAAALGGVYLRVSWDEAVDKTKPFLTTVDVDQAVPEYRWGRLMAVTFWQVIARDNLTVWRHLERHELAGDGTGVILHGLYQGRDDNLGVIVPLTDQTATAPLALLIDANSSISTESPGLAVVYVPNQRPQRLWRTHPVGKNYGRSDLDGVEPLMDALDEVYSSLMRDIRLGKARLMVAKSLLENQGAGSGSTFNNDQEIYSSLSTLGKGDQSLSDQVEQVQFTIRVTEHLAAAQDLIEQILRTAGYSSQTFGEGDTGSVRTATEIESRERRSLMTRDRKMREWRPGTADILEKLLAVDAAIFNSGVPPERPEVIFSDGVQETQLALAQTVQALYAAEAASLEVRVGIVHPDWDDVKVAAEVSKIKAESQSMPSLDPFAPPDQQTTPPADEPASTGT